MLNINFVPDDYIQNNESHRVNLMYIALLVVVMVVLGGSFTAIRMQQRALNSKEEIVNTKMARAQEAIEQFEELQTKRKAMMRTALTTAELLEPVPRSVLLASLTNNLPPRVSLLRLRLVQKEPKKKSNVVAANKYQAERAKKAATGQLEVSAEKSLETHIDIEGIAPSDIQVAAYIERLSSSALLDNVALIESKEHKTKAYTGTKSGKSDASDVTFRRFKLKAMLSRDVHLTSEDIKKIAYNDSE